MGIFRLVGKVSNGVSISGILDLLNEHIDKRIGSHKATAISNIPLSNLSAINVQDTLSEVLSEISTHLSDTIDAHDASAISNVPAGTIMSTTVQGAIDELNFDLTNHLEGSPSNIYGSFYLTTGGRTALSSTAVQLYLNTAGVVSGSISLSSNTVIVNKTADFEINANVYINNSVTARTEYSMWIEQNGIEIVGSRFASYQRGYDSGMSSGVGLIVSVVSGDTFKIMCQRTDGGSDSGYQDANGTRLTIIEL